MTIGCGQHWSFPEQFSLSMSTSCHLMNNPPPPIRSISLMLFLFSSPEENADPQSVLKEATEILQTKFGFYSTTIQVEHYTEDMERCVHCQDPID